MTNKKHMDLILPGLCAGAVSGLFGAGGGMILVPLLTRFAKLNDDEVFPASISMMLPICLVSLGVSACHAPLPFSVALPYLFGSAVGGVLAGRYGSKIPTIWLHRILGGFVLWGGIRYLC